MTIPPPDPEIDYPCPCFLYEDDGDGEERCACGSANAPHMLDDHELSGWQHKACTVGHRPDCPLDHGTTPCDDAFPPGTASSASAGR